MKKKIQILVTFILALAVSVGLFAGCGGKGKVTVEGLKATETVEVGKTKTLSATASDGSELEWSSSKEEVATVTERGRVTGVKAGTATITAKVKGGKASASCEVTVYDTVTFIFTKEDGSQVNSLTLDWDEAVKLTATPSDGSAITSWSSSDEEVATVANGLVTGISDGEAEITVKTATGTGKITVTVGDATGNKYTITTDDTEGRWRYYSNDTSGQEIVINKAEYRDGTVTFDFGGECNWNADDVFISCKNYELKGDGDWYRLKLSINSSVDTYVTIHETRVHLINGDNNVSVCYQQWGDASAIIYFGNGTMGTHPNEMKVVITNVSWEECTEETLDTPLVELNGNAVTITDTNQEEGVDRYDVALFNEKGVSVYTQRFYGKTGTLDTSSVETNGEFIVKVKAIANPGFIDSGWSTDESVKHEVKNEEIKYTLSTDGTHGGGAKNALTSGRWEYYAVTEEGSSCSSAEYANGTLTLECLRGWSWYGIQLFRHYAQYEAGTELTVSMTINSTEGGNITVCGQVVTLVAGEDKQVTVTVTQPSESDKTTLLIALGVQGNGQLPADGSLAGYTNLTFKVSNLSVMPKAA